MRDYQRILAIVDLDDSDSIVLQRAQSLARLGRAHLALLHLVAPDPNPDGGYPTPSRAEFRRAFEEAALRRLRFLVSQQELNEVDLHARYGDPAREFIDSLDELKPDLVIAAADPGYLSGRHDLLTLGWTSRRVRRAGYAESGWLMLSNLFSMRSG